MLSLKESSFRRQSIKKTILDLPSEILDIVLEYVHSSGGHLSSVIPSSLSCHHLRCSSNPILFKHLTILAYDAGLSRRSSTVLRHLWNRPQLLKHVRCLHVRTPLVMTEPSVDSKEQKPDAEALLRRCLLAMAGLRYITLDHLSEMTAFILETLGPKRDLRISLNLKYNKKITHVDSGSEFSRTMDIVGNRKLDLVLPPVYNGENHKGPQQAISVMAKISHLTAVELPATWDTLNNLLPLSRQLEDVEELSMPRPFWSQPDRVCLLEPNGLIPWHNLRKLQLEGTIGSVLLQEMGHQLHMTSLESLRLAAYPTSVFHVGCHSSTRTSKDLLTRFNNLKHLELSGMCTQFDFDQLTTPGLKSFQLQMPELTARNHGVVSVRSPADLKRLSGLVPDLERLEIHIGELENLWHPTAVPGADVAIEVYTFLEYLARFKRLRTLRLFPAYIPKDGIYYALNARQPISDEQAIRVFRHLKQHGSPLQTLSIGATFERLRDFTPMSWTVRDAGNSKTILTTRQAGKDYEIEQVWIGERRLTTRNIRHTYYKAYMPSLGDWAI